MGYRVISNYTEIAYYDADEAAAVSLAFDESNRYDDAVILEVNGVPMYLFQYGQRYRLGRPVARKSAAR